MLSSWPGVPSSPLILGVTLELYFSPLALSLPFCEVEELEGMISEICVSPFSCPFCFSLPSFMFCLFVCSFIQGCLVSPFPSSCLPCLHMITPSPWHMGASPYQRCCSVQPCLTLCDRMDCSTPGFPVLHRLPELAQTLVHWVGDAIPPSRPLSAAWKSQICSPLLNSAVSDVSSAAWNWPRWEYLHYGIQQRWQITPSARSQLLNNSSTSLLWPLSEQSLGINNLLLVKITMKEKSLIIQLWKSSAKLHI